MHQWEIIIVKNDITQWTDFGKKYAYYQRVFLYTVCSCHHVTYAFQSESTLYSWLNVKELLAWRRREIWSLSDCNWTRTQSQFGHGWVFFYSLYNRKNNCRGFLWYWNLCWILRSSNSRNRDLDLIYFARISLIVLVFAHNMNSLK